VGEWAQKARARQSNQTVQTYRKGDTMFNAKAINAPKINKFANAVKRCTKLPVTQAFRSASGPRFEINVERQSKFLDRIVVDVDRNGKTMRVSGVALTEDGVRVVSSHVVKTFQQFASVLDRKFDVYVD
jgi:hypothetical protein